MCDYGPLRNEIIECFPILLADDLIDEPIKLNLSQIEKIKVAQIASNVELLVFKKIEQIFERKIGKQFCEYFEHFADNEIDNFQMAIEYLYDSFVKAVNILDRVQELLQGNDAVVIYQTNCRQTALVTIIKSILFRKLSDRYLRTVRAFYERYLNFYESYIKNKTCYCNYSICQCEKLFEDILSLNRKIKDMCIIEFLVEPTVLLLVQEHISNYIRGRCYGKFDVSLLEHFIKWLKSNVLDWLKRSLFLTDDNDIMSVDFTDDDTDSNDSYVYSNQRDLKEYQKRFNNFICISYTKMRIEEIFNIIIEYPDSLAAVEDLAVSLPHSHQNDSLIKTLKTAIEKRLLHQGVSTHDILTAYIATIRTLKIIDPTGILIDVIIQPIHTYLRTRDDTIRCIVGSLTDDGPNDLADELMKTSNAALEDYDSEEDMTDWEHWTPEPYNADEKTAKYRKCMDIVSMLVNVYGSKELFANEYRSLLADRLLSDLSCDTDKEIRYLELLKLRFGDSALHFCEVMLKDISESKRIDNNIKNNAEYVLQEKNFNLTALIVSAQFWPQFKEESLELPESIQKDLNLYTKAYEELKAKRTLAWKPFLGSIEIEVEIKNETYTFNVSPAHAVVLMQFEKQEQWALNDLSKVMKMPQVLLKKKIAFWQFRGFLRETENDVFVVDEDHVSKPNVMSSQLMICDDDNDEDHESHMKSTREKREQELQIFWSYIVGMLTNLDSLPIDRIHQMLKMFASTGSVITDFNIIELRKFLDKKVQERLLEYHHETYSLAKN